MTLSAPDHFSLFDRIREAAGQGLARAVAELLPAIADDMRGRVDQAADLRAEMALTEGALVLRDEIDIRTELAVATLDECHVRALQQTLLTTAGTRHGDFALLGDVELSEQLLAAALAGKVRESLEQAWPAYLDRLSKLTGLTADDESSPLGARAFALAICSALRPYTTDPLTRDAVEAALLKHAVQPVRSLIAAADQRMVEAGILSTLPRIIIQPDVRRAGDAPVQRTARASASVVVGQSPARTVESILPARVAAPKPVAAAADTAAADTAAGGAAPAALSSPVVAAPVGSPAAAAAAAADAPEAVATPTESPSVATTPSQSASAVAVVAAARRIVGDVKASMVLGENPLDGSKDARAAFRHATGLPRVDTLERDAIAFAHTVGHPPFSTAARKAFFSQVRRQMKTAGMPAAQMATLDIVSAMFDYATDSDRIPDPAKPLLWRLQMPAVTLSCLDAGYLGDDPRSVRRLVEHVAAIATAWPDEMARGSELHGRLQTVVRAVEVVSHAFQIRSQVLSEQVRHEYRRATHGMGQLVSRVARERTELEANAGRRNRRDYRRRPSREREIEVSTRVEQLLADRLRDREIPDSVGEFLKGVWLRHLRTAILRDGEESPSYQAALRVVDDLLWTLDGKGHGERQSRTELAHKIPDMLRILTQGISDIGARAEDYRAFFDEMFLIHLRRMQKRRKSSGRTGTAAMSASDVVIDSVAAQVASDDDDLPILETPIAGEPPARSKSVPMAGSNGPVAPAPGGSSRRAPSTLPASIPSLHPAAAPEFGKSATLSAPARRAPREPDDVASLTILPPAPPRGSGFDDLPPITDAGGWPELSEAFVNESEMAVHGPRSGIGNTDPIDEQGDEHPLDASLFDIRLDDHFDDEPGPVSAMHAQLPPATDLDGQDARPAARDEAQDRQAPAEPRAAAGGPAPTARVPGGKLADDDGAARETAAGEAAGGSGPEVAAQAGRPAPRRAAFDPEAQSASELKLRRLIDSTTLDDAPRHPTRMEMSADELGRDLAPGQWLEMITSSRKRILAKVAWINERRSVVLLLQHPDRLILSRHVAALMDRAERRRVFRVR